MGQLYQKTIQRSKPLILILFFTILACSKLFAGSFYTSHDGEGHVIRLIEFENALKDGQFPVRLAQHLNHGLSYAYFNFNYPFIYYLGALLHLTGLDFVWVFKVILIISIFMGGLGMYLFSRIYFGELESLITAIFYIIAPYRFLNLYVRATLAECFALGLLPFLFLAVEQVIKNKNIKGFTIVLSLLILSHNITAFITLPLCIIYFAIRTYKQKNKIEYYKSFAFGILISLSISAFFIFPAILENNLTRLVELTEDYKNFFPSPNEIIYSPWGFGPYVQGNMPGKMSPQIGIAHITVFLIALGILFVRFWKKRKFEKKDGFLFAFLALSVICFFLMSPLAFFLWEHIYFLQLVQHPWRLVGYVILGTSIGAGYILSVIKDRKIQLLISAVLIVFLLFTNRNHIRVNQYYTFVNPIKADLPYGPSTTSKDEHMPIWTRRVYEDPNQNGDVTKGSGSSIRTVWKSNYHEFTVNMKQDGTFRDNTSYYPGWTAKLDGKNVQVNYKKDTYGRLLIGVPKGKHKAEFFFGETPSRLIADYLSVFGIIFFIALVLKKKI